MTSQIESVPDDGGVAIVVVKGEQDLYTAPDLRAHLTAAIEANKPLVVDLSPATFVDSSILGVLLGALRRAREQDSPFAVVLAAAGAPGVRRVFELTGLLTVFSVYDTCEQAAAGISQGA